MAGGKKRVVSRTGARRACVYRTASRSPLVPITTPCSLPTAWTARSSYWMIQMSPILHFSRNVPLARRIVHDAIGSDALRSRRVVRP